MSCQQNDCLDLFLSRISRFCLCLVLSCLEKNLSRPTPVIFSLVSTKTRKYGILKPQHHKKRTENWVWPGESNNFWWKINLLPWSSTWKRRTRTLTFHTHQNLVTRFLSLRKIEKFDCQHWSISWRNCVSGKSLFDFWVWHAGPLKIQKSVICKIQNLKKTTHLDLQVTKSDKITNLSLWKWKKNWNWDLKSDQKWHKYKHWLWTCEKNWHLNLKSEQKCQDFQFWVYKSKKNFKIDPSKVAKFRSDNHHHGKKLEWRKFVLKCWSIAKKTVMNPKKTLKLHNVKFLDFPITQILREINSRSKKINKFNTLRSSE